LEERRLIEMAVNRTRVYSIISVLRRANARISELEGESVDLLRELTDFSVAVQNIVNAIPHESVLTPRWNGLLAAFRTLALSDQKLVFEFLSPGYLAAENAEGEFDCGDDESTEWRPSYDRGGNPDSWKDEVPDDIFVDSKEEWESYKDSMPWD
jgi:hypothetical protein